MPAEHDRISQLLQEGEKNYSMVLEGKREKLEAAVSSFESVLVRQPNNYLAQVLLGGCYALKGQGNRFVFYNLHWGIKGLNLMDNAVQAAPDNYRIRLERAINSLQLNSFYDRSRLAGKDLEQLLIRADFAEIPVRYRQLTWLYSGIYFKQESRLDKSLQMWRNIIELEAGSDIARKAKGLLLQYEE